MDTVLWWSLAVENICDFLAGIVVPLGMTLAMTFPTVSIPKVNGVTSIKRTFPSSLASPPRMPP